MIIAYHAIFATYGTWLPNDPRGSYSKEVYNAELARLGAIQYGRRQPQPNRGVVSRFRTAALPRLSRPPYHINDSTRPVVAGAFAGVVRRLGLRVAACAIMNDHVHLVVMRSKHRIEYLAGQFKGAATTALRCRQTPWTRRGWYVFLDDADAVAAAARYVEANPHRRHAAPELGVRDADCAAGLASSAGAGPTCRRPLNMDGNSQLEYAIPRMGRRADAALLSSHVVVVVEFKIGDTRYSKGLFTLRTERGPSLRNCIRIDVNWPRKYLIAGNVGCRNWAMPAEASPRLRP